MAEVRKSSTTYTINITSSHPYAGGMTAWALRDFVKALDEAGIPDDAQLIADHAHDTRHFIGLRVRHTVTVDEPAVEADAHGAIGEAPTDG